MPFASDIVFVDESRYGVDFKLEIWRDTLDRKVLGQLGLKQSTQSLSLVQGESKMEGL